MLRWYYILFLITFSSCYFLGPSPVKRYDLARKMEPYDVAIVPGLPFKNGNCDTLLKTRIAWSVFLYKQGVVKNIIYSGAAVYSQYIEGKAMAIYAEALGVDPNHIFIDSVAEHSTENLFYSYELAKKHGFKKIALTTDPFQTYMLYRFSKKNFDTKIGIIPVVYDSITNMMNQKLEVDISDAISSSFVPLAERETLKERVKASRGGKIK